MLSHNGKVAAARAECLRRYPYNAHLAQDELGFPGIPTATKYRQFEWFVLKGGPDGLVAEEVTMAWPADGTEYACPPLMPIEQIARQTAPWDGLECDRCKGHGDYDERVYVQAVVLVPFRPYLIGMVLCPGCTYNLSLDDRARLIYRGQEREAA